MLDPPYSMHDWGDAPTYISERWRSAHPPPSSADMAWLQLALEPLEEQGRAYVLLPPSSLSRSGRDELIRRALLEAGVIEAIVLLPARLRRDTSIQLALWCLRAQGTREGNEPPYWSTHPDSGVQADRPSTWRSPRSTLSSNCSRAGPWMRRFLLARTSPLLKFPPMP